MKTAPRRPRLAPTRRSRPSRPARSRRFHWRRRLLLAAVAAVALYFGLTTALVAGTMGRDDRRHADAIVVLGTAQFNGTPGPVYRARLEHALELYREGVAPVVVFTGGRGVPGEHHSEGGVGRDWAIAHGLPPAAALADERSRDTRANLTEAAGLLGPARREVVVVSDPFHMFRAVRLAAAAGLDAHPSPTRSSPLTANPLKLARSVLREDLALGAWAAETIGATLHRPEHRPDARR